MYLKYVLIFIYAATIKLINTGVRIKLSATVKWHYCLMLCSSLLFYIKGIWSQYRTQCLARCCGWWKCVPRSPATGNWW